MFEAPPDGTRPRLCATTAAGTLKLPATCGPATLCKAPLTCTSIFGITYELRAFTCVRNFVSTWQYDSGVALVPVVISSGSFASNAQLSVLVRPVLRPPCSSTPWAGRAFTLTSTPFQCSICLPNGFASVTRLSAGTENLSDLTL